MQVASTEPDIALFLAKMPSSQNTLLFLRFVLTVKIRLSKNHHLGGARSFRSAEPAAGG